MFRACRRVHWGVRFRVQGLGGSGVQGLGCLGEGVRWCWKHPGLEPKTPQSRCAVGPEGSWQVTRPFALGKKYPKPFLGAMQPPFPQALLKPSLPANVGTRMPESQEGGGNRSNSGSNHRKKQQGRQAAGLPGPSVDRFKARGPPGKLQSQEAQEASSQNQPKP